MPIFSTIGAINKLLLIVNQASRTWKHTSIFRILSLLLLDNARYLRKIRSYVWSTSDNKKLQESAHD